MIQRTVSRRLLVGVTSAALLGGAVGFVPLLGAASAAGCPSWIDPAGDAAASFLGSPQDPTGLSKSSNLDVVSTTVTTSAATLTVSIKVTKLSAAATDFGDEFHLNFTAGGKALQLYSDRGGTVPGAGVTPSATLPVIGGINTPDAGFYDVTDNKSVGGVAKATYDLTKNTVTIVGKLADLNTLAGGSLAGKPMTSVEAGTSDYVTQFGTFLDYDQSTTAQAMSLGIECDAEGTPAPSGSPTPAPSGSPSPTPTPTPSGSPSPTPTSSDGPVALFDVPRAKCALFTDPAGDADPTPTGQDNENSLDVTQVNLKSPTDGSVQIFVKVADLTSKVKLATAGEGGVYTVTTNIAGKAIVVTIDNTGKVTATTVGGAASTDVAPTVKLDTKNMYVILTLPKAGLEKALKTTLAPATAITGTTVSTSVTVASQSRTADAKAEGTKPEEKTYAYGDNTCFLPPPGKLEVDADSAAQFTDTTELFATLTDADDNPVEGATVSAVLPGGKAASAVTDGDGIADIVLPVGVAAGSKTLTISFAGTSTVGAAQASVPFTVAVEKAVLKVVAKAGGAQATLLDDDKHPIAGQVITFTVGSKTVKAKTNASGVANIVKIAKGTAIKVGYAGSKGYYAATPSYTVKAL